MKNQLTITLYYTDTADVPENYFRDIDSIKKYYKDNKMLFKYPDGPDSFERVNKLSFITEYNWSSFVSTTLLMDI